MNNKSILLAGITAVFLNFSCEIDKEGFQKTENGLLYKVVESGDGKELPETGDLLVMDISYKNNKDSVLFDSKIKSDSFSVVLVEPTFVGGVEEGFSMMHVGDQYQFKVPADSVFLKTFFHKSLPPYIEPGSFLKFSVKLNKIIRKSTADSLSRALDITLRREEFDRIEAFLKKENMDVVPTQNGVYIKTIKPGNGTFASVGDSVAVLYAGSTIDGNIFDKVEAKNGPFIFTAGIGMVIPGWDEAIPYLDEGSISRIVVPSDLAYGAKGHGNLPGYSTLVFDIEIKKVFKH
jgi:FKBP-type peptidyl-prolyl cis-trans isomerase